MENFIFKKIESKYGFLVSNHELMVNDRLSITVASSRAKLSVCECFEKCFRQNEILTFGTSLNKLNTP